MKYRKKQGSTYISQIFTIYMADKKLFVANFGNYSKGIFGNHLTANGCQNVKSWRYNTKLATTKV